MKKQVIILLTMLIAVTVNLSAREIEGHVKVADPTVIDGFRGLNNVTVELRLARDSSIVTTAVTAGTWHYGDNDDRPSGYYKFTVDNNTDYILVFSMIGYKTVFRNVSVRMNHRVSKMTVGDVMMEKDAKMLQEVVVQATRVKMVMRRDTIVFNADAFDLAEGSMLDELISQLPGARLQNGVIYINGRRVQSLLVDGRDFFHGNATVALRNLPAYTVDKVKVYDMAGEASRLMQRDMNDKQLVVDVNLKKKYRHGFMANAEASGGTSDRYNSKLFAMGYGKKDRATVAGTLNNINDYNRIGGIGYSSLSQLSNENTQPVRVKSVYADYRHDGKSFDDYLSASGSLTLRSLNSLSRDNSQTYLEGGDTYNYGSSSSYTRDPQTRGQLQFGIHPKKNMLKGDFQIGYGQGRTRDGSLSATFLGNPDTEGNVLDSVFAPNASQRLMNMAVNRVRNLAQGNSQQISYTGRMSERIALGKSRADMMNVVAEGYYTHQKRRSYALNNIDYLGTAASRDYRDQFTDLPSESYNYRANASYGHLLSRKADHVNTVMLNGQYEFRQDYRSDESSLYRLDQLADYSADNYPLGVLPSTRDALMSVLDATNSYHSRQWNTSNNLDITLNAAHGDAVSMPRLSLTAKMPLQLLHENLKYYRQKSYHKSRTALLFNPNLQADYSINDSTGTERFGFSYSAQQQQPSLSTLLDVRDDANPLRVTVGNPALKKAFAHSFGLSFSKYNMGFAQVNYSVDLGYSVEHNAIANAVVYDKTTGITTSQMTNVNGNWRTNFTASYSRALDRQQHWQLSFTASGNYNTNVDLMAVEGTDDARSKVHNSSLGGLVMLIFHPSRRLTVQLNSNNIYNHTTGSRQDFTTTSAWNGVHELEITARLPWQLELSTTMTAYARSGYNDERMNTTDFVWNGRLQRSFFKKSLLFTLDAFDLLHQLNNTMYTVDAQGRTERWNNTIPHYVMLRCTYRFYAGMKRGI